MYKAVLFYFILVVLNIYFSHVLFSRWKTTIIKYIYLPSLCFFILLMILWLIWSRFYQNQINFNYYALDLSGQKSLFLLNNKKFFLCVCIRLCIKIKRKVSRFFFCFDHNIKWNILLSYIRQKMEKIEYRLLRSKDIFLRMNDFCFLTFSLTFTTRFYNQKGFTSNVCCCVSIGQ